MISCHDNLVKSHYTKFSNLLSVDTENIKMIEVVFIGILKTVIINDHLHTFLLFFITI